MAVTEAKEPRLDLILVRHGVAKERDPRRWPDDRERPLAAAGARRFRNAARGLARIVPEVDAIWSSRLRRAWQSAELLHEEARWPQPQSCALLEEGKGITPLLRAIAADTRLERLALVGHAPWLEELAACSLLGRRRPTPLALHKGGVACIRFDAAPRPRGGVLQWVVTQRFLQCLDA